MEPRTRSPSPPAFSSKFESVVAPPRRRPPTALRLVAGPLPPRSKPKHTLPSIPRPAFYAKINDSNGPTPRRRATTEVNGVLSFPQQVPTVRGKCRGLPPSFDSKDTYVVSKDGSDSEPSSPVSDGGSSDSSSSSPPGPQRIRAPWNHSSAIRVPFDVSAVIPAPRPAAVGNLGAQ